MKLQAKIDEAQYNELNDDLKENYQQVDDGYRLTIDGIEHADDVAGLKSALEKQKEKRTEAEAAVAKATEEVESLRAKLDDNPDKKEAERLRTELEQSEADLVTAKRHEMIIEACVKHQGNTTLLKPLLKERIQIDGDKVTVLDDNGQVKLNDEGIPLTVDAEVAWMRKQPEFAGLFKGTANSGGGSAPTSHSQHSRGGGVKPYTGESKLDRSKMTVAEKAAYAREHGTDELMKLPASKPATV